VYKTIHKSIFLLMIPGILFSRDISSTSMQKLSADLQRVISEKTTKTARDIQIIDTPFSKVQTVKGPSQEVLYPVTIRSTDIEAVKAAGIQTNSDYPGFSTARVTREQLLELSELGAVTSVFQGDILYPLNDLAVSLSGADLAHDGYLNSEAYDGTGVIILVIDTGIDWTHLDFRDPSDTTSRILYIWDQTLDSTGTEETPAGRGGSDFAGLHYGVEYTKEDIDKELDGSPEGFVRTKDTNGHGTVVAGAAAGNGASALNGKYKGMAPKADIIVVRAGADSFEENNVIDALTYAKEIAADLVKPVVVNLSLGSQSNAHDGTSTLDQAVNSFTSLGLAAGRVAVVAAGNAGNEDIHVTGNVDADTTENLTITIPSYSPFDGIVDDVFQLELWWSNDSSTTVILDSPSHARVTRTSAGGDFSDPGGFVLIGTDGIVDMNNIITTDHSNGQRMTELTVADYTGAALATGTWTLELTNNTNTTMTYHAWLYYSNMKKESTDEEVTISNGNHNYTIASPGTASSAITVGAYTARWRWYSSLYDTTVGFSGTNLSDDIAYFSSIGPTRDGAQKPDICAPGRGLISTTSTDNTPDSKSDSAKTIKADKYILTEGTSGASGVVSGAVALLLNKTPNMTADQVKSKITLNADRDTYTGGVANYTWGSGKLNIFEAMAAEIKTSTTFHHDVYIYDSWDSLKATSITDTYKEAVRFTPATQGDVSGAFFHTHTTLGSSGSISFEIWSDYQGGPSVKQGSTVTLSVTDISKNSWNYVSLVDAGVRVLALTDYHLVIDNTSEASFSLLKETAISGIDNRSTGYHGGPLWGAYTDRDWLIRPVVSTNEEPTDYSLPVELSFFNAGTYKGQMVLKWATESETENQGFRIDRRKSGTEDWKLIADHTKDPKLEGQGNSTSRTDYIYYDKTVKTGVMYDYCLTDIPYTSDYQPNSIVLEGIQLRIEKFTLHKNYPNPFNPATTIGYELPKNSDVQIKIMDVKGREVQSWSHQAQDEGYHEMVWAGVDHAGKPVSAGLYLLTVQAGNNFQSRKLLLLK